MLYIVSTPIGNLSDITLRAIETLKSVDYILCEDTRHTIHLLKHYNIEKPLKSFHKFNETAKEKSVIEDLLNGSHIALVSDAGTPGISDPGERLIQECIEQNINIEVIPGPCALISALSLSGLTTTPFQFLGFLPKKKNALSLILSNALKYPGTSIFYESPFRLKEVLSLLHTLKEKAHIVVARELTKKFEEVVRGSPETLLHYFESNTLKGEIVLLIKGEEVVDTAWEEMSYLEHVDFIEKTLNLSRKDAIKKAAEERGVPKREIYNFLIKEENS